ncbi:MAG: hypothetical protein ACOX9B_00180 [Candidatus Xenobium sp.]|nr:glycosyltransferase family 39 protein [Burkholderiales bacterium]
MNPSPQADPLRRSGEVWGDALLVAFILAALAFPAATWAQRWMVSPEGDGAFHVLSILAFQELFLHEEEPIAVLQAILGFTNAQAYPPLAYLIPGLLGALMGGIGLQGQVLLQFIWVFLTVGATFMLGRILFEDSQTGRPEGKGRRVSLLATMLVAFEPIMVVYVPEFLLELPATAMLMVTLVALARDPGLERRSSALVVGVASAGFLLTKWSAGFFLAPTLLFLGGRILRAGPRGQRQSALVILGLLTGTLMLSGLVATVFPPCQTFPLELVSWSSLLPLLAGLACALASLTRLTIRHISSGPVQNLLLGLLLASFLVAPYFSIHTSEVVESVVSHIRTTNNPGHMDYIESFLPQPFLLGAAWGLPAALLVGASLVWLAAAGPRGSFVLIGLPVLTGVVVRQSMLLIDYRYILPSLPLEILMVVGCLQTPRRIRALTAGFLLSLALWKALGWVAGCPVPVAPGHEDEIRATHPETIRPIVEALGQAVAEYAGEAPQLVWVLAPNHPNFEHNLQVLALDQGFPLVLRTAPGPDRAESLSAWVSVPRILACRLPDIDLQALHKLCAEPFENSPESWLLDLGHEGAPPKLPLPIPHLGPKIALPAPLWQEAHLQRILPSHALPPSQKGHPPASATGTGTPSPGENATP